MKHALAAAALLGIGLAGLLLAPLTPAMAENIYVTGVTKITMRTGPGTDHKILAMLRSGTALEIVEHNADWSMVRTRKGAEGWVLSRFLTEKVPDALVVEQLKKQRGRLADRVAALEEENHSLTVRNATLVQIEEQYNKLKKESGQFLALEARYKALSEVSKTQKTRIEKLESELNSEPKFWFLIGPGVFIVGLIFGLSTRKKRRSSLL